MVAAHKQIGLLQKLNKWQGKTMDKMTKAMGGMMKKIKSLERKVKLTTTRKPPPPPFRRSRSIIHHHMRPSAEEPPRASSFEPREAQKKRQKKRRNSSSRFSDFSGGLEQAPADFNDPIDRAHKEKSSHQVDFAREFDQAAMVEYSVPNGRLHSPEGNSQIAYLFVYD